MQLRIILLAGIVLLAGCKKNKDDTPEKKTSEQLLTQKQWLILAGGFDDNKNGKVDDSENMLTECQRDNIYIFRANGTGNISDNALICPAPGGDQFTWKLINNNQQIELNGERYSVVLLTEGELVMSFQSPYITSAFILTYHH